MIFPIVMRGYKSWTIEKAEHQRIDAVNCGVGEDSLSPLGSKEMKPVSPEGNQS